jgi:ribonuclease-3
MHEAVRSVALRTGYEFSDPALLDRALTHRSAGKPHNERLEFLGDAILNFLIADAVFNEHEDLREGELTRLRARLVRRETLASIARELTLGGLLKLGGGELKSGGRDRDSILADTLEAMLGAIYLDAGSIDACRDVVHAIFSNHLSEPSLRDALKDPKTQLQELLQSRRMPLPEYAVVEMSEEHHAHSFVVECSIGGVEETTVGHGGTRRAAEQEAARKALKLIKRP